MYTINGFAYVASKPGNLVQGVKGNRRPKNAFRGGNGSFIVGDPAQAFIYLQDEDGNSLKIDAAPAMRKIVHQDGKNLNENYAEKIYAELDGKTTENDFIDEQMLEEAWNIVKAQ